MECPGLIGGAIVCENNEDVALRVKIDRRIPFDRESMAQGRYWG